MTAHAGVDAAVEAVKGGAFYFLTKPFVSNEAVALVVAQAAQRKHLVDRTHDLEERLLAQERFGELVGTSARMDAMYRLIEGVATATSTVLLVGETGTGKELVARAIHQRSARAPGRSSPSTAPPSPRIWSRASCSATCAAPSRARRRRAPASSRPPTRARSSWTRWATCRWWRRSSSCARCRRGRSSGSGPTRRRLSTCASWPRPTLTSKGDGGRTFRSDLFYRLNVIAIEFPAARGARRRRMLLTHHFVAKYARRMGRDPKSPRRRARGAARLRLAGQRRQLEHAVERAVVLAKGDQIAREDLPSEVRGADALPSRPPAAGVLAKPTGGGGSPSCRTPTPSARRWPSSRRPTWRPS